MGMRLEPLDLGSIRPAGWLHRQLRLQADGLTGRVEELWPDVGPDSGWLGGDGEDWERGPYYLDGLVPLAHLLQDDGLLRRADKWIEWILGSQRGDGWFGPAGNDDWWPRMVALKVLVQHAEATGDERVAPFLARYFEFQLAHLPGRPVEGWGGHRATENALAALWLHRRDGDERWLALADLLMGQNADWVAYLTRDLITGRATAFSHLTHGPNVAMGLKVPAVRALVEAARGTGAEGGDGESAGAHYADLLDCLASLDRWHGQVHGMFSGDEWLAGREAAQGIETCQVVEYLYTLEQSGAAFGEGRIGDLAELVAYNHLAASCDPRMTSHQYHQQANQISATVAERRWTHSSADANVFGLEPHFGCCLANMHQGWPKFAASLWMRAAASGSGAPGSAASGSAATGRAGLAVFAYAPCTVDTEVAGARVVIEEETDYPFEETVRFRLTVSEPTAFDLRLRIPEWCEAPELRVNGAAVDDVAPGPDGYLVLDRTWSTGDTVELHLPMRLRTVRRERNALGVRLGPLVMVMPIREAWRPLPGARGLGEWEVTRLGSWNYGLYLEGPRTAGAPVFGTADLSGLPIERTAVPEVPFSADGPPVTVRARAVHLPRWQESENSAAEPPDGPVITGDPVVGRALVPYGSARLRIAEMPTAIALKADGSAG